MKPYITQEVKDKVCEVLDSGYLTEGPVTREFETLFKEYVGAKNAIAVTNCTNGLEIALRALKIGDGDEIIVPDYTYPATASVVNIVGAKIVIVDVSPENMLIDYDALEDAITERTKAIIPVSIFGNPLDWDRLDQIKEKYGLYMIEDAACSIGAEYKNRKVGTQADISVFSLHPRKFITTGEGGIITTDNGDWADWMISYKHFGMGVSESRLSTDFERIGTNYKLSNVASAIGVVQMKHIDELLSKRRHLAEQYYRLLAESLPITIPKVTLHGIHSFQSCCVFTENRDNIIAKLSEKGIQTQIGTYSLHMHKAFSSNSNCQIQSDMSGSIYAFNNCLTLPMYHEMTMADQQLVVDEFKKLI